MKRIYNFINNFIEKYITKYLFVYYAIFSILSMFLLALYTYNPEKYSHLGNIASLAGFTLALVGMMISVQQLDDTVTNTQLYEEIKSLKSEIVKLQNELRNTRNINSANKNKR